MMLKTRLKTADNLRNAMINEWVFDERQDLERQRDIKIHTEKLIECAKNSLLDQENQKKEALTPECGVIEKKKAVKVVEEVLGCAAAKIAMDIGAGSVISIERKKDGFLDSMHMSVNVSIFKDVGKMYDKLTYETRMRRAESGSIVPIKELLMEAIGRKYVKEGDRVVCVEDESLGSGYKGLLFVFDVDQLFFRISTHNLAENINSDVLESIINIAMELAKEGREGKKIGTSFIMGNSSEILPLTKQLVINPFSGYPEDLRKVTDPGLKETVKEFSQLDGCFIIDEKGTIVTAGAYLNVDTTNVSLPGFGTRHRCSAAMTKQTNAIAVVLSQSGGKITIFKNGKVAMRLQ